MAKNKFKKKTGQASDLQQELKDAQESLKRAIADYQNLENRIEKQKSTYVRLANASLVDKLLGVLDDLQRAVNHTKDRGLKLIIERFQEVLKSEGVSELEALGKEFNPETMDCVEMIKGEKNKVIEVQLKGYTLNDQLIRPAKVKVGAGK